MVRNLVRGPIFTGSLIFFYFILMATPGCAIRHRNHKNAINSSTSNSGTSVIWRDPGKIEELDFVGGAGGRNQAPRPPYTFLEENLSGSNPKVRVEDSDGVKWSVKFGPEVNAEIFATRIAWAAGYFVEPAYFVASGRIQKLGQLKRAKKYIKRDGSFTNARFEMQREKEVKSLDGKKSWSWVQNPFVGSQELSGLKVVIMLVSNWDNKDVRDHKRGSNTEILQYPIDGGTEDRYLVNDWGASMGKWGGYFTREKWDAKGYKKQTGSFIKATRGCAFIWGFSGQHTTDFVAGIRVSHVRWLMQYLGRISDDQLRAGLQASGATPKEVDAFSIAMRQRLDQIKSYLNGTAKLAVAHTRPRRCIDVTIPGN